MVTVFIDGEAGTTGMKLAERLRSAGRFKLLTLPHAQRKLESARRDALNTCDIAVLCLPDEAARASVAMIHNKHVRVLDASVAHRVADGWVYGFPELTKGQRSAIANASRVTNPGCFATGAVALLRPLVDANLLLDSAPLSLFGVSGYSGGGRALIEAFEDNGSDRIDANFYLYSLDLKHKHVPEIVKHGGVTRTPIFLPSVGRFRQGMLVSLPLHVDHLSIKGSGLVAAISEAYAQHYGGCAGVSVHCEVTRDASGRALLDPEVLNNTNDLEIFVLSDSSSQQLMLVARLDNLGKGSSGAAMQNLEIMAGLQPGSP